MTMTNSSGAFIDGGAFPNAGPSTRALMRAMSEGEMDSSLDTVRRMALERRET
jgi:hypothetical protein